MENFIGYTEVDPNSRITRTTRRVTWTALQRNEDAYVYSDKGASYFNDSFIHYLTICFTASQTSAEGGIWALTNELDDLRALKNDNKDLFYLGFIENGGLKIQLAEVDGGSGYADAAGGYVVSLNTIYYLKIVRDESVGTHGTLYMYTYSDPARATLLNTQTITLHTSTKDFRYIHAIQTWNAGTTHKSSGYSSNFDLITVLLEVTTQPVTSITTTTATGNGIIVNTGLTTVSQHGVCWDITLDPTTTDSSSGYWGKASNGEGSLGAFTSNIINILAGQQYYVRAYATNDEGTVYGANVTFTAGYISTQLIAGNLAVVQGHLQYIDAYGVEKYIPGIIA